MLATKIGDNFPPVIITLYILYPLYLDTLRPEPEADLPGDILFYLYLDTLRPEPEADLPWDILLYLSI